ncbi:MAG: hypothetical protein WD598_17045 [Acidimicrobiia bacterium]
MKLSLLTTRRRQPEPVKVHPSEPCLLVVDGKRALIASARAAAESRAVLLRRRGHVVKIEARP